MLKAMVNHGNGGLPIWLRIFLLLRIYNGIKATEGWSIFLELPIFNPMKRYCLPILFLIFPWIKMVGNPQGYAELASGEKIVFGEGQWQVSESDSDSRHRFAVDLADSVEMEAIVFYLPWDTAITPQYFLSNGFQSWSITREYAVKERIKPMSPLLRAFGRRYGDWEYVPLDPMPDLYGWTYGWIRGEGPEVNLVFSLSDHQAYSCIIPDFAHNRWEIHRDFRGKTLQGKVEIGDFWLQTGRVSDLKDELPLEPIGERPVVMGWTSWYNFYTHIDEGLILTQLQNCKQAMAPGSIFQIDDGYQAEVGDWLETNAKFPRGMRHLADSIHAAGFKAGIWWAPFVVSRHSRIVQEHPDWILKEAGTDQFCVAGTNPGWGGKYYPLDIYHPEAKAYIQQVARTLMQDWGYDMMKVDFLFAACIQPRHNRSRAEVMTDAIALLREAVGDKWILGCGTPLAPGFGQFDYCRIGPDVHLRWEFGFLKRNHARERPDTHGAIQSTCSRWILDGKAWGNDPDVMILRRKNQHLREDQRILLYKMNRWMGSVLFTSDDLALTTGLEGYFRQMMDHPDTLIAVDPDGPSQWRIYLDYQYPLRQILVNAGNKTYEFKLDGSWRRGEDHGGCFAGKCRVSKFSTRYLRKVL